MGTVFGGVLWAGKSNGREPTTLIQANLWNPILDSVQGPEEAQTDWVCVRTLAVETDALTPQEWPRPQRHRTVPKVGGGEEQERGEKGVRDC